MGRKEASCTLAGRLVKCLHEMTHPVVTVHHVVGVWTSAAQLADEVRRKNGNPEERPLVDEDFEFRGGVPELSLRRRARTRWSDHPGPLGRPLSRRTGESTEALSLVPESTSLISAVVVDRASLGKRKPATDRSAASGFPAPQASVTMVVMYPKSAPLRTVGSIPISISTPTMMKVVMPRSRRAMSSGVPSNGRHRDLVENGFRGERGYLRHELKAGGVAGVVLERALARQRRSRSRAVTP
jgi:hypothetical protein